MNMVLGDTVHPRPGGDMPEAGAQVQGEQTKQEKPTGALLAGAPRSQSHWGPLQSTWNAPLNYPLKNEGLGHLSPARLPRLPAYKLSGHPRDATCHV